MRYAQLGPELGPISMAIMTIPVPERSVRTGEMKNYIQSKGLFRRKPLKLVKKAESVKAEEAYSMVKKTNLPESYRLAAFEIILSHLLLEARPVPIEKRSIESKLEPAKSSSKLLPGRITELASEGFFNEPRTGGEVQSELRNRGYAYSFPTVGMALLALTRRRDLRRILEKKGDRKQYLYTNP